MERISQFSQRAAGQLAVILETCRLYSELAERAAVIAGQHQQMTKELDLAPALAHSFIPERLPPLPGLDGKKLCPWQPRLSWRDVAPPGTTGRSGPGCGGPVRRA